MVKKTKEIWKTYQGVFDQFTNRTLFKLASQGHFLELKSPISIGKESHLFTATTNSGEFVAIKIHRLETSDFNSMYNYIRVDPRYNWLRKHQRKIIFAWTQREFRNLLLAREAGVSIPKPIAVKENILIMEFIGNKESAPQLKNQFPKKPKLFLDLIIKNMKKMYEADFVHGDLSDFNILNYNEKPVLIDFSQATNMSAPNGEELFERDIKNISNFFSKQGLNITPSKLREKIVRKT
ncbi:serine protein kinase RIO [Candidatus Woesearchaeota archaeon]|nr:serine protein kinase RIO [Candidatus Woesearchaeota archaeon]